MILPRPVRGAWGVVGLLSLAMTEGCGGALVQTHPEAPLGSGDITAIVMLPPRLGFGKMAEQRRAGRRAGDFLIEATGGHAILADELPGTDPELVDAGIRSAGEDPKRTLVFSILAARENRAESNAIPGMRGAAPVRRYLDFTVRLDVRSSETNEISGSVETYSTAYATSPEVDPQGHPLGLAQATREAILEAIRRFAPNLVQSAAAPRIATLAELPTRARAEGQAGVAVSAFDKLRKLKTLYPEVAESDLTALATSNARFLVIVPGYRSALGLELHDLLSGMAGRNLGGRGAFARALARGNTPALSVDRGGNRFLIGQTMVAHAP